MVQIEGSLRIKSVIKGKIKIKWDKTKLVSHLGGLGGLLHEERRRKEEEEEEKKKRKKKRRRGRRLRRRGFQVWILVCSISRV